MGIYRLFYSGFACQSGNLHLLYASVGNCQVKAGRRQAAGVRFNDHHAEEVAIVTRLSMWPEELSTKSTAYAMRSKHMERISRERVERVARIYASNKDASQVLGITLRSFGRLCRKFGIETPYARRRRLHTARPGGGH